MLHEHLRLVKTEVIDILTGNYSAGIAVYDVIERQTIGMADMLANGILCKFPNRFVL